MFNDRHLKIILKIIVIGSVFGLLVTACAGLTSQDNKQDNSGSQSADSVANSGFSAAPVLPSATKVDTIKDVWEKQRAAYLRSLDYEKIDQQKNTSNAYVIKADIIDSRYHIENSEADLRVEHNVRSALRELRSAKQLFDRAISRANTNELPDLENSKSMLDDLIKQTELASQNKCDYPTIGNYQLVEATLENLLATL